MAIFGLYFVRKLLEEAGWPRKQGLFGKLVIDVEILDSATNQMVDWAASIGAGRPRLALQIVAYELKDKDWEGQNPPSMKEFVKEMQGKKGWGKMSEDRSPHEVIEPAGFSGVSRGPYMRAKELADKRIAWALEQFFMWGIFYGLSNPKPFERWYRKYLKDFDKSLPMYKRVGLDVEKPQDLEDLYSTGEDIVRRYERELMEQQLPPIPPKLLSDAKKLGVKI